MAIAFRFFDLDGVPPGLEPDEASNANDALEAIETGDRKVFYTENYGREGLFINVLSYAFQLFGVGVTQLRAVAAFAGVLAVIGVYAFAREFTQNKYVGLFAMFATAITFWFVQYSRIAFRASFMVCILAWALFLLFYALRTKKLWAHVLAGFVIGLGFYTYIPYRIFPLFLAIVIIVERKRLHIRNVLIAIGTTVATLIPLAVYFLQNPIALIERSAVISVMNVPNPEMAFFQNIMKQFGIFVVKGDPAWVHNLADDPLFLPILQVIFLIGVVVTAFGMYQRLSVRKRWYIFAGALCFIVPPALSVEDLPHGLRSIGTLPFVFTLCGIGAWWLVEQIREYIPRSGLVIAVVFLVTGGLLTIQEYDRYFVQYKNHHAVHYGFLDYHVDLASKINSDDIPTLILVDVGGTPMDGDVLATQSLKFLLRDRADVHFVLERNYAPADWAGYRIFSLKEIEHTQKTLRWCVKSRGLSIAVPWNQPPQRYEYYVD